MANDSAAGFDDILAAGAPAQPIGDIQISDFQRDSLRELANIAAGVATTTLSMMVKREVKLGLPFMDIVRAAELPMFQDDGAERVIAYCPIGGGVEGNLVTVLPGLSADTLVGLVAQINADAGKHDVIVDIGAGISKSYIAALVEFLGIGMTCAGAKTTDARGGVLARELGVGQESLALMLETDFAIPGSSFEGDFILLADRKSIELLLAAVGEKLGR
jgi:chemotaxis protein CheC